MTLTLKLTLTVTLKVTVTVTVIVTEMTVARLKLSVVIMSNLVIETVVNRKSVKPLAVTYCMTD